MNKYQRRTFWISLIVGCVMMVAFCMATFSSVPSAKTFKPWIPEGARVVNTLAVHPGTFKINVDMLEMINRVSITGESPLVVFSNTGPGGTGPGRVEYWLPGKGGIFDHSSITIPIPFDWLSWDTKFISARGIYELTPGLAWPTISFTALIAIVCLFLIRASWRREVFANW